MTRGQWRKGVNAAMLSLTGLCTILVASVLFVILAYLAWNGGRSLNWDFFTKLPDADRSELSHGQVKDVQLLEPLFEFSGACAGCGEKSVLRSIAAVSWINSSCPTAPPLKNGRC